MLSRKTLSFALLLCSCGGGSSSALRASDLAVEENTSLGIGDVFDVRVYGEEDLSAQYRVGQDGAIDFPFVGHVEVMGLEASGVAEVLRQRLLEGNILVDPHVSVVVREYNSRRITVLGAVRNPGSFPMRSGLRVVEAISLAGGFTALANRDGTVIRRREGSTERRIRVPVDGITSDNQPDVPLRSGDTIHVPERTL